MLETVRKALIGFPNVAWMLKGLSPQLWGVFMPDSYEKLKALEANIAEHRKREMDPQRVTSLQRLCGFKVQPNFTLSEVQAMARIQGKKKSMLLKEYLKKRNQADDNIEM